MSKYVFEMDDASLPELLNDLAEIPANPYAGLIKELTEQIPIPTPVKIGAVVRTVEAGATRTFVRWTYDAHSVSPWFEANDHEEPYRTDQIGRITEVLSPGVDL